MWSSTTCCCAGLAPSLYMRGVARHRLGKTEEGDDDIATAIALYPKVADTYTGAGILP